MHPPRIAPPGPARFARRRAIRSTGLRTSLRIGIVGALVVLAGCSDPEPSTVAGATTDAGVAPCGAGSLPLEGGGCLAAGTQPDSCAAGSSFQAGACEPAGVPPALCTAGFVATDDGGCAPVLPDGPCAPGTMATPGDPACREVAPCGAPPWGTIPLEADTQFVDAAYAGNDSDGTAERPWTGIDDGIDAAAPGAVVALAPGSYAQQVLILDKAVRLWGLCPGLVEIDGIGESQAAVSIGPGTDGTEIHDVAIRGVREGVFASASTAVVFDRVWIHDVASEGMLIVDDYGPVEVTLRRSLVEAPYGNGVLLGGATFALDASVVRGTRPGAPPHSSGEGVSAQLNPKTDTPSDLTILASLVDGNAGAGVLLLGSKGDVEGSVVRATQPGDADSAPGWGLVASVDAKRDVRAELSVRSSVVSDNRGAGLVVVGADVVLEGVVVRDTKPRSSDGAFGRGIDLEVDPATGEPAILTMTASLVAGSHDVGLFASGADVTVARSVVRDTKGAPADVSGGFGLAIQNALVPGSPNVAGRRSSLQASASAVERSALAGIFVQGSDASLDGVVVRDTTAPAGASAVGYGMVFQSDPETHERAAASVRWSAVERSVAAGLLSFGADATVESTLVLDTAAAGDTLGDGLGVVATDQPVTVAVVGSRVQGSTRVGLTTFGAALTLRNTAVDCNSVALNARPSGALAGTIDDSGDNACGCGAAPAACQIQSLEIDAPAPVDAAAE